MNILSIVRQATSLLVGLTIITGVAYPLLITGIGECIAHDARRASPVVADNRVVGYKDVGQHWTRDIYFWGRPSAIDCQPLPSSGSNLGPTSAVLRDSIIARRTRLASIHGTVPASVPDDLVTVSASGIDPHISPEAAYFQLKRIAIARQCSEKQTRQLQQLIDSCTEQPQYGFLGMPRVNVLQLNMRVDALLKR